MATLGIHWHTSTLGMQTLAVTTGGIDINEALAYISKMMLHTKVSAALEFMVVSSVSESFPNRRAVTNVRGLPKLMCPFFHRHTYCY
jgi:hypothetical protein